GPPGAREGLLECLALGADRAIHLLDPLLAGSDTLATARALGAVLRRESPDFVLFGRASTDAETGQVAPQVAELLGLPQVTAARDGAPVWVVAELGSDGPKAVTAEPLAKAAELAVTLRASVEAVVIGGDAGHVAALAAAGADRVLIADGAGLVPYTTDAHAAV